MHRRQRSGTGITWILRGLLYALVRKFKEGLVVTVTWVGKGVDWFLEQHLDRRDEEREHREEIQALQDAAQIKALGGYGASVSVSGHRKEVADMERQAPEIMKNRDATLKRIEDLRAEQERLTGDFGILQAIAPTRDEEAQSKRAEEIQGQIQQLQKMLEDAEAATKRKDLQAGKEETDRIRARFFGTHDGMEKAYADAKKDVERLQKQLLEPDKPLTKAQAQDLGQQLHTAEATEARRKAALDAVAKGAEQLKEFQRQAAEFEKKGDESELDATGKIYYQRDLLLKQAEKVKASEAEIAAIRASAEQQAGVLYKKSWEEFEKYADKQDAEKRKRMLALMMPSKEQMKEWEEGFAAQEKIEDIGVQAQREELRRRAGRSQRMAELTGGDHTPVAMSETDKKELAARKEEAAAQQAYQVRLDLAVQLAGIEAERISKEENAAKRSVLAAQAQKDLFTDLAQAQDQFEEKQAQLQQKREQELQSQIDGLQKQAEKLIDVLFTKPANFGKDLLNTIHSAVLKPITETLGGAVANVLHPIVYGSDGQGGINGMLRGTSKDPVRVSTDMNTAATMQNSAVMAGLTAILAAGMGMAAPHVSGGTSGVPSISAPSISVPAPVSGSVGVSMPTVSGRSEGASLPGPIVTAGSAPAAAPSVGDLMNLPMSAHAGGGMNPLATILGSGSKGGTSGLYGLFSKGGASKALSNLKGTFWNQDAWNASDSNFWGGVQGVAKSPAAGAAGMMLATSGLFGSRRGTWAGTLEDTAGGALIGEQIGGPWGAAIGAAAGFTAGVVEQLLGIKSPAEESARRHQEHLRRGHPAEQRHDQAGGPDRAVAVRRRYRGGRAVAERPSTRDAVLGSHRPEDAAVGHDAVRGEPGGAGRQALPTSQLPGWPGARLRFEHPDARRHRGRDVYPTPGNPNTAGGSGATYMSLNISGADAANFMTGQFVTPQFVTDQAMAAQYSSYGRTQQSANMQLPGLTVA